MTLLTKKEAARLVSLHPESIMRMARQGRFVLPIRTGPNQQHAVRFVASEITAWIEARMAERDDKPQPEVDGE